MSQVRKPQKGDKVGEYILEERLGGGGFGEVWKASHPHLPDDVVAVKIPTDPAFIENLKKEGVLQADLAGEHIVDVKGLDPYADPPYLTMEYVAGMSLRQLLVEKGRLPLREALHILLQALQGLSTAHERGIVHHDIKPENILLTEAGVVKLADFGLGRANETTASMMLHSGSMVTGAGASITGTLRYMAPEQREGQRGDGRSDLYSLGVVFFEMLTGEFPQGAERPSELLPGLPAWVDRVFERCYTRLEKRYATAREMLDDLTPHGGAGGRGIVFLGDVEVRAQASIRPTVKRIPTRPPPKDGGGSLKAPGSIFLWPIYFIFLVFHILARGTQELIRFLQSDHPNRSRVAPYFVLFLGLFGVSLLASIIVRRGWFHRDTRAAQYRAGQPAPGEPRNANVPISTLIQRLQDDEFRWSAREELSRRGPQALDGLLQALHQARATGGDRGELASLIAEIHLKAHPERIRPRPDMAMEPHPLSRADFLKLVTHLQSKYWRDPARLRLVTLGPPVVDPLLTEYMQIRSGNAVLAKELTFVLGEILAGEATYDLNRSKGS